ncbi:MAG: hypothetical protein WC455_30345 [Dehalococcoidia bacterium]|jgi:uncharacterized protein (DUF983 family)
MSDENICPVCKRGKMRPTYFGCAPLLECDNCGAKLSDDAGMKIRTENRIKGQRTLKE